MNQWTQLITVAALFCLSACKDKPVKNKPIEATQIAPVPEKAVADFSGTKAFDHIKALNDFGPRPSESEGYRKSLAYLEKELQALGWKTKRQSFQNGTPVGQVNFTNLLARYAPDSEPVWEESPAYLVGGHLDTKRYSDIVFLGANDSGSSTGVMMELARVLTESSGAAKQVELVFFDGEEAMLKNIQYQIDGLYGSIYYAKQLRRRKKQPVAGIVIDLVGDIRVPLWIGAESHKNMKAHAKVAAQKLKLEKHVIDARSGTLDDHIPLIAMANLPTLHLIGDFNQMPYWHTKDDTLEQLSPEALENCGKLTLQILHQLTN